MAADAWVMVRVVEPTVMLMEEDKAVKVPAVQLLPVSVAQFVPLLSSQ